MLSVTDFNPKGIISGVRVQAGLYLDMLDADRSPNAVSVLAGTSQVDFEVDCPPACLSSRRPFDHHGKGNGNFVKKRVSKNEKKSYLSLIWKRWKREMTARLPVTVSSVQTWFYMSAYGARHHNWPLFVIAAVLSSDVARRQLRYRCKAGNESYPTPKTACACDVRLLNYAWNNADWLTGDLWSCLSTNHQRLRCNGPNGHSGVA